MDSNLFCLVKPCNIDVRAVPKKNLPSFSYMTFSSRRLTGAERPFFYSLLGLYCLKTVLSLRCVALAFWILYDIFCSVWLSYLQHPFQNFLLRLKSHPRPITSNYINGFEKSKEEATNVIITLNHLMISVL